MNVFKTDYRYTQAQIYKYLSLITDENEIPKKDAIRLKKEIRKRYKRGTLQFRCLTPQWCYRLCAAALMQNDYNWFGWETRSEWAFNICTQPWIYQRYNGKPSKLIVLAEQGLGDELLFSKYFPHIIKDCPQVTIEADHRLIPVFQRTFGNHFISRYAEDKTRRPRKLGEYVPGEYESFIPAGNLPKLYVKTKADIDGGPYLIPDDDKVNEWCFKLSKLPRPWVGIAWEGRLTSLNPEDLMTGGSYINLDYANPKQSKTLKTHPDIHYFPQQDYDDTINLVAALDRVNSITTTIAHVSAGLGVETHVIKPEPVYGEENNRLTWYLGRGGKTPFWDHMTIYRSIDEWRYKCKKLFSSGVKGRSPTTETGSTPFPAISLPPLTISRSGET